MLADTVIGLKRKDRKGLPKPPTQFGLFSRPLSSVREGSIRDQIV